MVRSYNQTWMRLCMEREKLVLRNKRLSQFDFPGFPVRLPFCEKLVLSFWKI